MVCAKCGAEMDDRTGRCPNCDSPVIGEQAAPASVKVPNYLIVSIITTLCCCWIGGIIAIIFSVRVDKNLANGDIEGAKAASRAALGWIIANVVIGLLVSLLIFAVVSIPNFMRYRGQSQTTACISNMKQIQAAAESYMMSHSSPPSSLDDLCGPDKIIKVKPKCPKDGSTYKIIRDNGTGSVKVKCGSNDIEHVLPGDW